MIIPLLVGLGVLVLIAIIFFVTYTVVDPNEAHIIVFMGKGRTTYTPHVDEKGEKKGTSYFYIPFLMTRRILPLANVKMEIPSFELKDSEVAPFLCEVTTWFRIEKPDIAVEKLDIVDEDFESAVRGTLEEQVRGVARAAAMKQELLDLMRDRKTFGQKVEEEVNGALEEWGLELVKLEIVDFSDVEGSNVIKDYENMRKALIQANSRKAIAEQNRDAEMVEAEAMEKAGIRKAQAEREVEKANVDRKRQVDISTQKANAEISKEEENANLQKVEANRKLEVGNAEVKKEALIQTANGEAESVRLVGKAKADVVALDGTAQATAIEKKGLAEATATDKMAEAQNKFDPTKGIIVEQIKAWADVEKVKAQYLGEALKQANVDFNIVGDSKDANSLFGFNLGGKGGAQLGQMLEAFKGVTDVKGKDVKNLVNDIADVIKKNQGKK